MDINHIQQAVNQFQLDLFNAVTTASYNGSVYDNGQKAKEALIRSQTLICLIHESTKKSIYSTLAAHSNYTWQCHPPLNQSSPELKIYGKLKGKDQDVVFLRDPMTSEIIADGPNQGEIDNVGFNATKNSIVVGVRSQMSSVEKNFDTLMERAFAETLNLRLRIPSLVMGEVYLLPLKELDDKKMEVNEVRFKSRKVNVGKFTKIFNAFTGRENLAIENQYKYDASALLLVDLEQTPPKVIFNEADLSNEGFSDEICNMFAAVKPEGFDVRLVNQYNNIQNLLTSIDNP